MEIILVYNISDNMFQAYHSYEWFLHQIMDNTIKGFNDFINKLKSTNMVTLPFPFKPRQTKGYLGKLEHVGVAYLPFRPLAM